MSPEYLQIHGENLRVFDRYRAAFLKTYFPDGFVCKGIEGRKFYYEFSPALEYLDILKTAYEGTHTEQFTKELQKFISNSKLVQGGI